jgi:hypothetical protein
MQFHWSDSDLRGPKDGCESLAPFVMALFDGEASEEQAKRARAHLLMCQTCANRWLDWNRSRDLLRSVTVPAPPTTLMWRVLMACRLASHSGQSTSKTAAYTDRSQVLRPTFDADSGAPDALKAQILARTTQAARGQAAKPQTASSSTISSSWGSSSVQKSRRARPVFFTPSFAVPALALWLMVLQRDAFVVTQAPETAPAESSLESPERAPVARPRLRNVSTHAASGIKKSVPHHVIHRPEMADEAEAPQESVFHPAMTADEHFVRAAHVTRQHEEEPHRVDARNEYSRNEDSRNEEPREETRDDSRTEQRRGEERPAGIRLASMTASLETRPVVKPTLEISAPALRSRAVKMLSRPATLSGNKRAPGLRPARWELATPRTPNLVQVSSGADQAMRVSLPSTLASSPAPTRLLADNFDSDDERVEEVRSVVDDFRASLASDSGSDPDTDDFSG